MAQLFLDAFVAKDFSGIAGNLAKFGLSVLAMGFDILFMLQHYVLYRKSSKESEPEVQPILPTTAEA